MTSRIPNEQLYSRWDVIPYVLKEAIASETNSDIVWKAGEVEHLPQEKIAVVSRLAGYALMGFIHPEDIAKEIEGALGINPNIAASIGNTLNSRLFNSLKSELEKIYAPAVSESNPPAAEEAPVAQQAGQPVLVEEIKKPFDSAQGKPAAAPGQGSSVPEASRQVGSYEAGKSQETTTAVPPKPMLFPSQQSSVIRQKSEAAPAPFILHQETEFAPIKPVSGFRLEIPEQKFGETKPAGIPPRPAQVEMGSTSSPQIGPTAPPPKPPSQVSGIKYQVSGSSPLRSQESSVISQKSAAAPPPRVVHYTELRTPLPPKSQEAGDKRQETGTPALPKLPASFDSAQGKTAQIPVNGPIPPAVSLPNPPKPPAPAPTMMEIKPPLPKPIEPPSKKDYLPDPLKEPELPAG